MADFTIRSDSVDVEQIMGRIRARIREKRGVDYTEQEIQDLAAVKLERFLDPKGVRTDLLQEFKKMRARRPVPPPVSLPPEPWEPPPNFAFDDTTLYASHRALVRWIRRLLRPLVKLFFNPNPLIQALHIQSQINTRNAQREERELRRAEEQARQAAEREAARQELDALSFEVLHNLVVEITRLGIEVKNLKMRVESLSSRLDFDERRARALEGVVQYRPGAAAASKPEGTPPAEHEAAASAGEARPEPGQAVAGGAEARRRRRRRRGRRSRRTGSAAAPVAPEPPPSGEAPLSSPSVDEVGTLPGSRAADGGLAEPAQGSRAEPGQAVENAAEAGSAASPGLAPTDPTGSSGSSES